MASATFVWTSFPFAPQTCDTWRMKNRVEHLLLWGSNLWFFGEGLLGPLFAVFAQRVGGNILEISWAWAIYLLVAGVMKILVGKLSDGPTQKERIMIVGFALNALCTFGYLLVRASLHLFIVQVGLGLAAALATPTWSALYALHQSKRNAGNTWGLASGEASIASAVAILIGGFVVHTYSFTALFVLMGSVQVIATIYQARIFF